MTIGSREFPNSSNVDSCAYNLETKDLFVVYRSGDRAYRYRSVPASVWTALCEAESVGKFINKEIKNVYEVEALS